MIEYVGGSLDGGNITYLVACVLSLVVFLRDIGVFVYIVCSEVWY